MLEPLQASPVLFEMARHLQAQSARPKDELFTAVVELVSSSLTGSARAEDVEVLRGFICADWLVRAFAPKVLTHWKRKADAERLKGQKPLESQRAAEQAVGVVHSISLGIDDGGAQGAFMTAVESAAQAAAKRDATGEAGRGVAAAWLAAHAAAREDLAARRVYVTDVVALVTHLLQMKTR